MANKFELSFDLLKEVWFRFGSKLELLGSDLQEVNLYCDVIEDIRKLNVRKLESVKSKERMDTTFLELVNEVA